MGRKSKGVGNIREFACNEHANRAWTSTKSGEVVTVAFIDRDLVENNTWSDAVNSRGVRSMIKGQSAFLHRVVAERMGLDSNYKIETIDGNFYNCHRSNIVQTTEKISRRRGKAKCI